MRKIYLVASMMSIFAMMLASTVTSVKAQYFTSFSVNVDPYGLGWTYLHGINPEYGESIYQDFDLPGTTGNARVTAGDIRITPAPDGMGGFYPAGSTVIATDTDVNRLTYGALARWGSVKHADPNLDARYNFGEYIYKDSDASNTVTAGDTRYSKVPGYKVNSVVVNGDVDVGVVLTTFKGTLAGAYERFTDNMEPNTAYDFARLYVDVMWTTDIPNNSPDGMRGYHFYCAVDPNVLTPYGWRGGTGGYVLTDYLTGIGSDLTTAIVGALRPDNMEATEQILGYVPTGAGDVFSGGRLLTLIFIPQSETAYSLIDLLDTSLGYQDAGTEIWHQVALIDGEYNARTHPVASFSYAPTDAGVGVTITFDASASYDPNGFIVGYTWDFGDGTTNSGAIVTHAYAIAGTYNVRLTVTDNDGLTDTTTKFVTIGKLSSAISISVSPEIMKIGESTIISGSITPTCAGETVTIWHRLLGQSWSVLTTAMTDSNSQYSVFWMPSASGTYDLKARWLGDANTSPAESSIVTVEVLPIVLFHDIAVKNVEASPTSVMSGDPVTITITIENQGNFTETFDVTARYNDAIIATATIVDLASGSSRTLTFIWDTSSVAGGTYTINGEASPVSSEIDTANNHFFDGQVTVITDMTPPIAIFTYAPPEPSMNEVVTFDASASTDNVDIVLYEWDFGDEATATGMIVTHVYAGSGTYNPRLTVWDAVGNRGSTFNTIKVSGALSVKLSGEFDYLRLEPVRIRLVALVRDAATMEPVSSATVNVEIYDDAGNLWVSTSMQEKISGSGIYEWKSQGTIGQLKLSKGVYLVRASAAFQGGPAAYDALLFHIDPPSESEASPSTPLLYYAVGAALIAGTTIGLALLRRHRRRQLL